MKAHGKRARLGGVLLAVALAAAAILALPTIGLGKQGSDDGSGKGHRPAGTISSFDNETGELTVALGGGGSISALVVRRTQIRCGRGRHHLRGSKHRRRHGASASRRGESEPGEDRGHQGEDEPGEDRGGRGLEPGDHGVEPGEDSPNHHGGRRGGRCNVGDLVEGAVVVRAEIVLTHGKALYRAIGLLPPQLSESGEPEEEA